MNKVKVYIALVSALVVGVAAWATDLTVGGTTELPAKASGKLYVVESQAINFATYNSASGAVHNVINVPANTWVLSCGLTVDTASTDTGAALSVGDGDDPDGWVTATSITTAATKVTGTENGYSLATDSGKLYTAADTIDIAMTGTNATTSTGIVTIRAVMVEIE